MDVGLVAVPLGQRANFELAFTNDGDAPETFSAGWRGPSPFELDAPTVIVPPGEAAEWSLAWTSTAVGRFEAELEVRRGNLIEVVLVDAMSVEAPQLRCRIDLPEPISREAALPTELMCRNRSAVPVEARVTGLDPVDLLSVDTPSDLRWSSGAPSRPGFPPTA